MSTSIETNGVEDGAAAAVEPALDKSGPEQAAAGPEQAPPETAPKDVASGDVASKKVAPAEGPLAEEAPAKGAPAEGATAEGATAEGATAEGAPREATAQKQLPSTGTTKKPMKCKVVDLQGYVIIVAQTKYNKIKLYGSPAERGDHLDVADEILDINDTIVEDMGRAEVLTHINQCIQSCEIKMRVKRRGEAKLLRDIGQNVVQDAFLIAVEEQARQRLRRLSALKQITPVDMSTLSLELTKPKTSEAETASTTKATPAPVEVPKETKTEPLPNGYIQPPITENFAVETKAIVSSPKTHTTSLQSKPAPILANGIDCNRNIQTTQAIIEVNRTVRNSPPSKTVKAIKEKESIDCKDLNEIREFNEVSDALDSAKEHLSNGHTEKLIGEPEHRIRTTAIIETNKSSYDRGTRRRSGSSIVVLGADDDKRPLDDQNMLTMLSITSDTGPHREMAVDVPDSFIARNKTPPRYPPPRPPQVRLPSRDDEPLLSSSGGSGTSFGSKQSTVLNTTIDHSDTSGSYKNTDITTLDMLSGQQSPRSFGSKKSSKGSVETAKCGDMFSDRSTSVGSNNLNEQIMQLLISNGDDSLLDCREGVSYSAKTDSVLIREALYASYKLPAGFDTTPVLLGREVAVDVPDSFVQIVKATPKYPATADNKSVTFYQAVNGSSKTATSAPAPQVPAVPPRDTARDAPPRPPTHDAGSERIDSIRKYLGGSGNADSEETFQYEQLRQRKEAEERAAAQNEFLRTSIRGSSKLQALEANAAPSTCFDNVAYEEEPTQCDAVISFNLNEMAQALIRVQKALGSEIALSGRFHGVSTVVGDPEMSAVLSTRAQVVAHRFGLPEPITRRALERLRDAINVASTYAGTYGENAAVGTELMSIIGTLDVESLILAHDMTAALIDQDFIQEHRLRRNPNYKGENGMPTKMDDAIKIITIEKTNEPLGATVRNEGDAVIVGRIVRGGAAEKTGLLHEGDELLEVNGVPMRGKSVHEVCQILSGMSGRLTVWIAPHLPTPRTPASSRVLHVRAHFDYDPEDDVYIPCRELGISFQKGDVLHVISRDDVNWWQAYREGEEDQTLAGLIPSQAFQHQRESMKVTLAGDVVTEKPRKSGTLLCAKKAPKKKRGKKATSESGYPLYSASSADEYDYEEILTYEEVTLYYPRASQKRPIVLIGPPNIGRHELRQRLMEDGSRFAAAVPHTSRPRKDQEVPGQDYHFISRTQFEADILNRKFVEHGEYEKAYYGTSLEAIREVVNSGKICVLNLHPQSLKILRGSDLKPYTVFVAPPSLEKLRQKKIRNGESFKEDELKEIIATARDMELRWGHLFDMIIINNDTQRAYQQLLNEINSLEREPQWVPARWLRNK